MSQGTIVRPMASISPSLNPDVLSYEDKVVIQHPAYEHPNILIAFHAWDKGCFHFGTALTACQLIACNQFKGYLSRDRYGEQKINEAEDYLLPAGHYWFHVPNVEMYPIYTCFDDWRFPHDDIPTSWKKRRSQHPPAPPSMDQVSVITDATGTTTFTDAAKTKNAVCARDNECCLSGWKDSREAAHLCPKTFDAWFTRNAMDKYSNQSGGAGINDMANQITLRQDIHHNFDQKRFVIVPKEDRWVAHFLNPTTELLKFYHNCEVRMNQGVSGHFLFARFAYAIFGLIELFDGEGKQRRYVRTVIYTVIPNNTGDQKRSEKDEMKSRQELRDAGKFKNPTKKRKSSPDQQNDEEYFESSMTPSATISTVSSEQSQSELINIQHSSPDYTRELFMTEKFSGKRMKLPTALCETDERVKEYLKALPTTLTESHYGLDEAEETNDLGEEPAKDAYVM